MNKAKYVIIGGGITSLYFANQLKNEDYIIIEKNEMVGGYCRTFYKKDFIWDCAGHFYHFKNEKIKNDFIRAIGEKNIIKNQKNTKIYYKDKYIDYPFQKNIHELEKDEFIDCLYDLYTKKEKEEYQNFLDMLYGKFGKSIVEKFLKPYNEKLYACSLETLDKDAMGRFFPYANIDEIIRNMKEKDNNSYNDTFLYPKNGAQSYIDYLYNKLDKNKVLLNCKVEKLNDDEKFIELDNENIIYYDYLINTCPYNQFLELFDDKYTKIINDLSYNKVLVFNLGFSKKSLNKEHWIYFPDKSINFYRVGFYNNILNTDKMSLYVEIGFSKNAEINIEDELEKTLENLKKCNILDEKQTLEEYNYIVMDPAYVHINTEETKCIEKINEELNKKNIYSIGRYGKWTYCSMEDCMIQGEEIYKAINQKKEG